MTVLVNDFAYIFNEMKDAAACLEVDDNYQKLQSKPPSSCTAHHTKDIPIQVNHTDVVDDDMIDIDSTPADSNDIYPFDHFYAMFLAMDINSCHDPCTIMAFATHQQQRNSHQARPCYPCVILQPKFLVTFIAPYQSHGKLDGILLLMMTSVCI